jgi:hypothetical protein
MPQLRKTRFIASILFAIATVSSVALAGKPERDKQKELATNIAATKADLKSRCGCNVAIDVKWDSYATASDMNTISGGLADLVEATKDNCDDATEKKSLCSHLKTYVLKHDTKGAVTYAAGTLTCGTADSTRCGSGQLNDLIDKW